MNEDVRAVKDTELEHTKEDIKGKSIRYFFENF